MDVIWGTHGGDEKWIQSLKWRYHSGDLYVDGRKKIKIHLKEVGHGLDSTAWGQGPVAGCCEHGSESLVSTQREKFIDKISEY